MIHYREYEEMPVWRWSDITICSACEMRHSARSTFPCIFFVCVFKTKFLAPQICNFRIFYFTCVAKLLSKCIEMPAMAHTSVSVCVCVEAKNCH